MEFSSISSGYSRLLLVGACLLACGQAAAAVPVEESVEEERPQTEQQTERRPATSSRRNQPLNIPPTIETTTNTDFPVERPPATASAGDATQLSELFYQMQVLQREIQDLRGQIEEQGYLIRRLQREQAEKYADVDRRLADIGTQPAPTGQTDPVLDPSAPPAETPRQPGGFATERDAYSFAFDEMRARRFDESIDGFQQLIVEYPNGQFTPNAFYWLGELYLAKAESEQARQSFIQVVNLYPDHQKVPDALYKLGVVYHSLGDGRTALDYLNRVLAEHPRSSAAGLASKLAEELR